MKQFEYEDDGDWIVNVAEGLIKQTRADYIKGTKTLYAYYKYIPTQQEVMENKELYRKIQVSNYLRPIARWFFDARRFVDEDPYGLFVTVVKREVLNEWNEEAKRKARDENSKR